MRFSGVFIVHIDGAQFWRDFECCLRIMDHSTVEPRYKAVLSKMIERFYDLWYIKFVVFLVTALTCFTGDSTGVFIIGRLAMGLFKPAWMSKNRDKALPAIKTITDLEELRKANDSAPLDVVREAANNRLILLNAIIENFSQIKSNEKFRVDARWLEISGESERKKIVVLSNYDYSPNALTNRQSLDLSSAIWHSKIHKELTDILPDSLKPESYKSAEYALMVHQSIKQIGNYGSSIGLSQGAFQQSCIIALYNRISNIFEKQSYIDGEEPPKKTQITSFDYEGTFGKPPSIERIAIEVLGAIDAVWHEAV